MGKSAAKVNEFAIKRSIRILASDTAVFGLINDLRRWEQWNPNGRGDTTIVRTCSTESRGIGAVATWRGRRSGAGNMQIISAVPFSMIVVTVDFERPFKLRNVNTFKLVRAGPETLLTWSMRGPKPLLARLIGLIFDIDKSMAKHFDAGLATLKSLAEGEEHSLSKSGR
jgi:Polyketide cyclase / dehydrase and lipid transport